MIHAYFGINISATHHATLSPWIPLSDFSSEIPMCRFPAAQAPPET